MQFNTNGQNDPEMLVLQYPHQTDKLTIMYPSQFRTADITRIEYPTPPWGKRRCIALGGGRHRGETVCVVLSTGTAHLVRPPFPSNYKCMQAPTDLCAGCFNHRRCHQTSAQR
jgi:hypothetical protein